MGIKVQMLVSKISLSHTVNGFPQEFSMDVVKTMKPVLILIFD